MKKTQAITLTLSDEAVALTEKYAKKSGMSVSDYIVRCLLEKLEDEEDLESAEEAYKEYLEHPEDFITFEELKKELFGE